MQLSFRVLLKGFFGPLPVSAAVRARAASLHSCNDVYNAVAQMARDGVQ
jgi:hypothetical protein